MVPSLLLVAGLPITLLAVVLVFREARKADIAICFGIGVVLIVLGSGSPSEA
jgi:hypothetical protein